jgi:hypothetical protein
LYRVTETTRSRGNINPLQAYEVSKIEKRTVNFQKEHVNFKKNRLILKLGRLEYFSGGNMGCFTLVLPPLPPLKMWT